MKIKLIESKIPNSKELKDRGIDFEKTYESSDFFAKGSIGVKTYDSSGNPKTSIFNQHQYEKVKVHEK